MKVRIRNLIGSRDFYRGVLTVAIPIVVQNTITNLISMLDNIMVGRIGTEEMSGVAIVNQLISVFFLCIFGAVSGAGIFSSQFFGKGDHQGVRYAFRFKLYFTAVLCAAAIAVFLFWGDGLIRLYLHEGSETGDLEKTFLFAKEYLRISLVGLIPYTLTQVYAGSLREVRQTVPPMTAGLFGIGVNLLFNWFLIFGTCGFPKLGVAGAAIATVLSRFVEVFIVVVWTHTHKHECEFAKGLYASPKIPLPLVKTVFVTAIPLMLNETLWSAGQAMLLQCYSVRGIAAVSALNISNTLLSIFSVLYLSMGTAVSILIGHLLGAGKQEEAYDSAKKMIAFSTAMGAAAGLLLMICAPFFPLVYNTTDEVRSLAASFTVILGWWSPICALLNSSYYVIRSGGKTAITFLFDSAYVWVAVVPLAYCLAHFSPLSIVGVVAFCHLIDLGKGAIGLLMVNKGIWLRNVTVGKNVPQPEPGENQ